MPEPRHLPKAPITEAIIDIRVKARTGLDPSAFQRAHQEIADRLPLQEERKGGQVTFRIGSGGPLPPEVQDLGVQGYFFKSEDGKLIAQFRIDGFTLNRLKPYTSWDELFPFAMDLWQLYVKRAEPEAVSRLALRYINHISLPNEPVDLDDYLLAAPPIPKDLPQYIGPFQTRVTIHDPEGGCAANVTQAFEPGSSGAAPSLLLDIDAFKVATLPPEDPGLPAALAHLHDFKNRIFFGMLSESTLRFFE